MDPIPPGLYYLINLIYNQTIGRLIFINKGIISFTPLPIAIWFLICMCNVGFPFSLNLIAEILLLIGLIYWFKYLFVVLIICWLGFCRFSWSERKGGQFSKFLVPLLLPRPVPSSCSYFEGHMSSRFFFVPFLLVFQEILLVAGGRRQLFSSSRYFLLSWGSYLFLLVEFVHLKIFWWLF